MDSRDVEACLHLESIPRTSIIRPDINTPDVPGFLCNLWGKSFVWLPEHSWILALATVRCLYAFDHLQNNQAFPPTARTGTSAMIKGLAHLYRSTIFSLERSRYILIVGHMRSRSSLLSHILGSHPAISGYAELRHSYLRPPDLIRLRRSAKATTSKSAPFYLDKLVSGWQQVSEEVVSHARVRTIYLIRKPKQTLRSIERLLRYEDVDWYRDPARVAAHYLERLAEISRLAVPARMRSAQQC